MHPENIGALHWSGVYVHIFVCIIEGSLNLKDVFHALNIDIHLHFMLFRYKSNRIQDACNKTKHLEFIYINNILNSSTFYVI